MVESEDTMQDQNTLTPILGEQSLLIAGAGLFAAIVVAGICFAIVLKKDPTAIRSFRGGRVLHIITILTVILATVILALERILTGEAVASIIGGIVGYVLGSLKPGTESAQPDQSGS